MYKVGDVVVYNKNVCKIKDIKENLYCGKDYYIMNPIDDLSLIIQVPVNNISCYRDVISKADVEKLISKIPFIETIDSDDKEREYIYKKLFDEGSLGNLIKIIKTTYLRNKNRLSQNKRIGEKMNNVLKKQKKDYIMNCLLVWN